MSGALPPRRGGPIGSPRHGGPLSSGWTTTSSRSCNPLSRRMHTRSKQARRRVRAHNRREQLAELAADAPLPAPPHSLIATLGWESQVVLPPFSQRRRALPLGRY